MTRAILFEHEQSKTKDGGNTSGSVIDLEDLPSGMKF